MSTDQCFSSGGDFAPADNSGDIFSCHDFGGHATGTQKVEARDAAAKHPTWHRAAPSTQNHPAQMSIVFIFVKSQQAEVC